MRQALKFFGLTLLALLAVAVSVITEEAWRARSDWEHYRAGLVKSGEELEVEAFIPPAIPDDANFFADPFFQPAIEEAQNSREPGEPHTDSPALKELKETRFSMLRPEGDKAPLPPSAVAQTGKVFSAHEWAKSLGCAAADDKQAPEEARALLSKMQPFEARMNELRRAAERPEARFPLRYERGFALQIPHVTILLNFAHLFCLHGEFELAAGNSDAAARDVTVLSAMERSMQSEPLVISQLVRMVILNDLAQVVWQGLVSHQWNDSQLGRFQQIAERVHILRDNQHALRGERAIANKDYERFRNAPSPLYASARVMFAMEEKDFPYGFLRFLPQTALLYRNQLQYNEWLEDFVFSSVDEASETVSPEITANLEGVVKSTPATPYNCFAKISLPMFRNFIQRSAAAHVLLREAETACAIERFRLKKGGYPESLSALVPEFLSAEIRDPFAREPLRYRRKQDGSYLVYSVGWNRTDEGGTVTLKALNKAKRDDDAADWVWFSAPQ